MYQISIIVPVYNAEKYINKAFSSIQKQTIGFENLEVILVDDVSTDQSPMLIDAYARSYSNVKAIHLSANSGYAGRPRNEGVKQATGKYLMFLDNDDTYHPTACQALHQAAEKNGSDLALGYFSIVNGQGKVLAEKTKHYREVTPFFITNLAEKPEILALSTNIWAKLFKQEFWDTQALSFEENMGAEDLVLGTRAMLAAKGITYIDSLIVNHWERNEGDKSISFHITPANWKALNRAYVLVYEHLEKQGKEEWFAYYLADFAFFYVMELTKGEYTKEELIQRLETLHFTLSYCQQYGYYANSQYVEQVVKACVGKDYEKAADLILLVSPFQKKLSSYQQQKERLEGEKEDLLTQLK
ncbi:MAG: glycosyltransferase, partial [Clostridiales bacterium]|nr:glycosyltransferase [Clostridiales bacterium]